MEKITGKYPNKLSSISLDHLRQCHSPYDKARNYIKITYVSLLES